MAKVKMWRPEVETLPREELEKRQLKYFRKQMKYVIEKSPFYRRKFKAAGVTPNDIKTMDDVRQVPFTTKQELLKSQEEHPIFGDFICIRPEEAVRVFQTSGTTGVPLKIPFNQKDWFKIYFDQFAHFLYGYGIERKDVAFFPFTYGTSIAWWGIQAAMEQLGVTIIPGGGQTSYARVKSIVDWGATVVCGTPTYIIYLGELAKKMGIDLPNSKVKIVITAGEPGAQVPAKKQIVRFNYKKCGCGRTFLRLDGGVLGRADDMFTFGGVNIFPSAIENFVRGIPTFSNEYQLIIPKQGSGKRMTIRVEPASSEISDEQVKNAVRQLSESIVYNIKITADIELVAPGSLPRFEGKAKRVIKAS